MANLNRTALRMLDRAVSSALNGDDLSDCCNPVRFGFKAGMAAAKALEAAGLGAIVKDTLGDDRLIVTDAGLEFHANPANAAKIASAVDILNQRGATVHY